MFMMMMMTDSNHNVVLRTEKKMLSW